MRSRTCQRTKTDHQLKSTATNKSSIANIRTTIAKPPDNVITSVAIKKVLRNPAQCGSDCETYSSAPKSRHHMMGSLRSQKVIESRIERWLI